MSHVHSVVKNYLEWSNREVLHHPPYLLDITPLDYHLFRSMQSALSGERFSSAADLQNWIDNWTTQKTKSSSFVVIIRYLKNEPRSSLAMENILNRCF